MMKTIRTDAAVPGAGAVDFRIASAGIKTIYELRFVKLGLVARGAMRTGFFAAASCGTALVSTTVAAT